jgi:hypothetical protein
MKMEFYLEHILILEIYNIVEYFPYVKIYVMIWYLPCRINKVGRKLISNLVFKNV